MAWKLNAVLLLTLALRAAALGTGALLPSTEQKAEGKAIVVEADSPKNDTPQARADHLGDLLPSGAVARLGTMRFRHDGEAGSLVFSPDGKTLAARCQDGVITLWDARTGQALRRLQTRPKGLDVRVALATGGLAVGALIAFSADSTLLAAPQDSQHIGLWETATGKPVRTYTLLEQMVKGDLNTLRFSPDGKYLAVGGANHTHVLDVAAGKWLHHFKENGGAVTFSPNSSILVQNTYDREMPRTHWIQLRSAQTGEVVRRQQVADEFIRDFAFSPDGKTLAAAGTNKVVLYEAATLQVSGRIEAKMSQVVNLAFTPDGQTLVAGGENGKIHVFDVATVKERRQLDPRMSIMRSMALSPDGKTVAAGTVHNAIRLWDLPSGKELFEDHQGHDARINSVAYSPDGKRLVSAGENGQLWIWNTTTGKPVHHVRGTSVRHVAFSPDAERLVFLSPGRFSSGKHIHLCNATDAKELQRLPSGDVTEVAAVGFGADGKTLVSADWKHTPDRKSALAGLSVWDTATGGRLRRFEVPGFHPHALSVSPDGRLVAVAGTQNVGSIRICDLDKTQEILNLLGHDQVVTSVAFAPDGRTVLSGSYDRTARLWEVATGKQIFVFKEDTPPGSTPVAFSPCGRIVASAGDAIHLWDVATGNEIQRFEGVYSRVTSLAFSPDGGQLASGLANSTVLLWDVSGMTKSPPRPRPSAEDLQACWTDLAAPDARKAHTAIWTLAAVPQHTVSFLKERLRPTAKPDPKRIRQLIIDVDSNTFTVRNQAARELTQLAELAEDALRQALKEVLSLEKRRRLEQLLEKCAAPVTEPHSLRGLRAVAVLEMIGTPPALELLRSLAGGAPEARVTQAANASLARGHKRAGSK